MPPLETAQLNAPLITLDEHRSRNSAALSETAAAIQALRLFADYDRLRLETYRRHGPRGAVIAIRHIAEATALRFDDVGYFNRVYAPDASVVARLAEVEAFFDGCPFPCELIGPPASTSAAAEIAHACLSRGWPQGHEYTWLAGDTPSLTVANASCSLEVRPPHRSERERFLRTYLNAFEADPSRFEPAYANMQHLFDRPELQFLLALVDGEPAGIGMLYRQADSAVLCAGATLPHARFRGCHAALLSARIVLARDQRCAGVYSWASADGQSQANMERAGLLNVGRTVAWSSPQSSRGAHA